MLWGTKQWVIRSPSDIGKKKLYRWPRDSVEFSKQQIPKRPGEGTRTLVVWVEGIVQKNPRDINRYKQLRISDVVLWLKCEV